MREHIIEKTVYQTGKHKAKLIAKLIVRVKVNLKAKYREDRDES